MKPLQNSSEWIESASNSAKTNCLGLMIFTKKWSKIFLGESLRQREQVLALGSHVSLKKLPMPYVCVCGRRGYNWGNLFVFPLKYNTFSELQVWREAIELGLETSRLLEFLWKHLCYASERKPRTWPTEWLGLRLEAPVRLIFGLHSGATALSCISLWCSNTSVSPNTISDAA